LPLKAYIMQQYRIIIITTPLILFIANSALAAPNMRDNFGHFILKGAAGVASLSAGDAELEVVPDFETDDVTFDREDAAIISLGVGYIFPLQYPNYNQLKWFPSFTTSLDVSYQFETEFSGDVFLFGSSAFLSQNKTEISNTNLIFNIQVNVAEYQDFSFFILGGLGPAWTEVKYKDRDSAGQGLTLDNQNNLTLALQAGGGIGYAITPALHTMLRYQYTNFGQVETAESGNTSIVPGADITAAKFDYRQQSLLLGLEWHFL
jgi:opacity protein-like surface antigen